MEDSRRLLEANIGEYFSITTSNERKREIELVLDGFSKQPGSWNQAMYFLTSGHPSQYVSIYCLSVVESAIRTRWLTSMTKTEQDQLKSSLYTLLNQLYDPSRVVKEPQFLRNKTVKLLVDIGKFSWPHAFPEFLESVLELMKEQHTVPLALLFLKTISEEWSCTKDEISTDRKIELKSLLLQTVPTVFKSLSDLLVCTFQSRSAQPIVPIPATEDIENFAPVVQPTDEIIAQILEVAAHFCSWIPLDGCGPNGKNSVTPFSVEFVQLLCQIALFSFRQAEMRTSQVSSLALSVTNELLYRKFIPKAFDDHINFAVRFGVELLNEFVSHESTAVPSDPQFVEKSIEYLCLIASSHFHRFDEATAKAFVCLLLPFTFSQVPENMLYYHDCLEIWARLLDHLNAQLPVMGLSPSRNDFLNQIKQPIMNLAAGIMRSQPNLNGSSYSRNDGFLEETLCQDEDDDDAFHGVIRNVDILIKIGELFPSESLQYITTSWDESYNSFVGLVGKLDASKTKVEVTNPHEIERFNFLVNLIGRMANIFYGDVFRNELELGKSFYGQLLSIARFSKNLYSVTSPESIRESNLEIMSALKPWVHWLSRYHTEIIGVDATSAEQRAFFETLGVNLEVIFNAMNIRESIDAELVSTAANLFSILVNLVRTPYFFQHPAVRSLLDNIHSIRTTFSAETLRYVHKGLAGVLLLPWYNSSNQDWETRSSLYNVYIKRLGTDLIVNSDGRLNLVLGLQILTDQVSMLESECSTSKRTCWAVLKDIVAYLQGFSLNYLKEPVVCDELLSFFLKILEVLHQQSGTAFFEETVKSFLTHFSTENIIHDLLQEHEKASFVVERFLQMLQFMAKDASPAFRKFLPDALSLCYDHLYPIVSARSAPELKIQFFTLIRHILVYRWSYFSQCFACDDDGVGQDTGLALPSRIFASSVSGQQKLDEVAAKRLDQILQSVGQSFLQPDIEVFRFNLSTMLLWNEKHSFFKKLCKKFSKFFDQFLQVLFQVLIQKSHEILRDEVCSVVYGMASVDYGKFCLHFIPNLLDSSVSSLKAEHKLKLCAIFTNSIEAQVANQSLYQSSVQLPPVDSFTFVNSVNKFVDDLRFFHNMSVNDQTSSSSYS